MNIEDVEAAVQQVLEPEYEGPAVDKVMWAVWKGCPVEVLRPLFESGNHWAPYMANELDNLARPFLPELVEFTKTGSSSCRINAIRSIAACATWAEDWALARVVLALDDEWWGTRSTAMELIAFMAHRDLVAGLTYLKRTGPKSVYANFLACYKADLGGGSDAVASLLNSEQSVARRFAAAVCLKSRLVVDQERVDLVSESVDEDLANFLQKQRKMPLPFWARPRRVTRDSSSPLEGEVPERLRGGDEGALDAE